MTARGPPRRVVVTGMGAVSSIGVGLTEFHHGLAGRPQRRRGPVTAFDTTRVSRPLVACEGHRGFAATELGQAAGPLGPGQPVRRGGGQDGGAGLRPQGVGLTWPPRHDRGSAPPTASPRTSTRSSPPIACNDGPGRMDSGADRAGGPPQRTGPGHRNTNSNCPMWDAYCIGTACSAGNYAIGDGPSTRSAFGRRRVRPVRRARTRVNRRKLRQLSIGSAWSSPDVCRPVRPSARKGILPGEGAGMLLLESLDSALARGRGTVHAEVAGVTA